MRWSGIVLHHSLTKDGASVNWKAIIRYHKEHNGWSDVGYHFGIERVGKEWRIYEGRSLSAKGAHVKERDFNAKYIGICLVGNYDKTDVPKKAWNLAVSLVEVLQSKFDIPTENVIAHREAQAISGVLKIHRKTCPGLKFDVSKFREEVGYGRKTNTINQ